jgi:hypothetical protein
MKSMPTAPTSPFAVERELVLAKHVLSAQEVGQSC